MFNRHIKKMFNIIYQSLGKCKSKSQLKYYFTLFRMAIIKMFSKKKKNKNKKCWQGEINSTAIETLVHQNLCTLLEGMQNGTAGMGNNLVFPQKAKQELPYDSAVSLLGIYLKELKARIQRFLS